MRRDTLSFAMDVAAAKWRAAKSENELIYHEPVIPVLSDDDDNDCLGNNISSSISGAHSQQLERVKGASLVKPIGFTIDDPELLTVVINNNESSYTTMTLFKDLVPAATRHRAAAYRLVSHRLINTMLLISIKNYRYIFYSNVENLDLFINFCYSLCSGLPHIFLTIANNLDYLILTERFLLRVYSKFTS